MEKRQMMTSLSTGLIKHWQRQERRRKSQALRSVFLLSENILDCTYSSLVMHFEATL